MIEFTKLKPYIPKTTGLRIPPNPKQIVHVAVLGENTSLLKCYPDLYIPIRDVRHVTAFPFTAVRPTTYLRQYHDSYGLIPIKSEQIPKTSHNFFDDLNFTFDALKERRHIKTFNVKVIGDIVRFVFRPGIVSRKDAYHLLLYVVDLDQEFEPNVRNRKIWPWLYTLHRQKDFIFDQVILVLLNDGKPTYVNLGTKNNYKLPRILSILRGLHPQVSIDVDNYVKTINDPRLRTVVKHYLQTHPDIVKSGNLPQKGSPEWNRLVTKAVLFYAYGDDDKVEEILKSKNTKQIYEIISTIQSAIIRSDITRTQPKDPVLRDFRPHLYEHVPDIVFAFKDEDYKYVFTKRLRSIAESLEKGPIPLKVVQVQVDHPVEDPSELRGTKVVPVTIKLKDPQTNKTINVKFSLPYVEGNLIRIYGNDYTIINQLALKPLTFPKPHTARIQTDYTTLTLEYRPSMQTYRCFVTAIRDYLILILFSQLGIKKTLELFGVTKYHYEETKSGSNSYPVLDRFIVIDQELTKEAQYLLNGLNRIRWSEYEELKTNQLDDDTDVWNKLLIKRHNIMNLPLRLRNTFTFILDDTSKEILKQDGLPTDIYNLVKYACIKILDPANVDDRNDISKQRIRFTELMLQHVEKVLLSAYSSYVVRRSLGDDEATIQVSTRHIISQIVKDPNVQPLERVSPLEELSFLTRVSPTGIGGVPTADAVPLSYRSVHPTYFGNISPTDTPESGKVGVTQHLSIGATLRHYGIFTVKDIDDNLGEQILSPLEALVPFVHHNDGARVIFSTNQMRSAVPLVNAQPPAVQTGYETMLVPYLSETFVKKAPCDGEVTKVDDEVITIKCADGSTKNIIIEPTILRSGQTVNVLGKYKPLVNVGDKVRSDDIIANCTGVKDNVLSWGLNLHVALMPYEGYNFEDAIVISESVANKMVSEHVDTITVQLKPTSTIRYIAKPGQEIKTGDTLIDFVTDVKDYELITDFDSIIDGGIRLRSEADGYVLRIDVYPGKVDYLNRWPQLKEYYEQTIQRIKRNHGQEVKEFKWAGHKIEGAIVQIHVVYRLPMQLGDKMANRHGNKGVVGLILPDDKMPVTPFGKTEVLLNPLGIVSRMNIGQIPELYCGLISYVMGQIILKQDRSKALQIISKVYNALDPEIHRPIVNRLRSMTQDEWFDLQHRIETRECFLPIIAKPFGKLSFKNVKAAMKILNLKPKYKVYMPEFETYTLNPVAVGWMYIQKLEHMSKFKLSARGVRTYVSKTLQPPSGRKKEGGQRLGELESWALMAYDSEHLLWEFWGALSDDHITKSQIIKEIIESGEAHFKKPKFLPTRDAVIAMLLARHINPGIDIVRFMNVD